MNSVLRTIKIDREVSSGDFRGAMRHLAGGVSVITVGRGRDITGMTVTSVSSLSVDPPTLIVSINRESSSWALLKRHGFFGVNILTADQLDIAERFTGKGGLKGSARFAGAQWITRASGVPLLAGALAAIDCEVEDIIERHSPRHRDRTCARYPGVHAHRGAGLLAGAIRRDRSERRRNQARGSQPAGFPRLSTGLIQTNPAARWRRHPPAASRR
jgi:flavin reductase (DIM6/NTAB) family NADH-FMN oxidoreductase RutF